MGNSIFQCKECSKYFITDYTYNAYQPNTNPQITLFTREVLGIRSTAQILRISVTTLLKRIISITEGFVQPFQPESSGVNGCVTVLFLELNGFRLVLCLGKLLNFVLTCPICFNFSLCKRQSKPIIPEYRHCYLNVYNSSNEGVYLLKNREL